jgi:hypothetical protein
MIERIKNFFRRKSEQERMEEYLSQATSIQQIEYLQREWDRGMR